MLLKSSCKILFHGSKAIVKYRKNIKKMDAQTIAVIILKFGQSGFTLVKWIKKDADGMAKSVDSD